MTPGLRVTVGMAGDQEIIDAFASLRKGKIATCLRRANKEVMGLPQRESRLQVPVDSGLLRKSLGVITRKYGGIEVSVLGARTGFRRYTVSRAFKAKEYRGLKTHRRVGLAGFDSRPPKLQDPIRYAHLVEGGHVIRNKKGGPVLGFVRGRPFMKPSFDTTKGPIQALWPETFIQQVYKAIA